MSKGIAVVIGAGSIGRAIARRIGAGRLLLLADYSDKALAEAAEQLGDEGYEVTTRVTDVSDRAAVEALADAAAGLGRSRCRSSSPTRWVPRSTRTPLQAGQLAARADRGRRVGQARSPCQRRQPRGDHHAPGQGRALRSPRRVVPAHRGADDPLTASDRHQSLRAGPGSGSRGSPAGQLRPDRVHLRPRLQPRATEHRQFHQGGRQRRGARRPRQSGATGQPLQPAGPPRGFSRRRPRRRGDGVGHRHPTRAPSPLC